MNAIPKTIANKIYDILVEHAGYCDRESNRSEFVYYQSKEGGCTEFRFQGNLGFGGKFWNNGRFYVSAYKEEKGPKEEAIIEKVNELLKPLYQEYLKA